MNPMSVALEEILNLDVEARLEHIEEIWESMWANPEAVPLTASQREESDRRKREHRQDPSESKPWSEVHGRLENRIR